MVFPATDVVNTYQIVDGAVFFSDFGDNVNLNNFPETFGREVRMASGSDFVTGTNFDSPGYDNIIGGNLGNDSLTGGIGRDFLKGGNEDDFVNGAGDSDYLVGGKREDVVFGGFGNDRVGGGQGNDQVFGEVGNDILVGGFGRDFLTGGLGLDRFILNTGTFFDSSTGMTLSHTSPNASEVDVVTDFALGDRLVFTGIASVANLMGTDTMVGGVNGSLVGADINGNFEYIVFVQNITTANLFAGGGANFFVGASADDFAARANDPTYFLQNPNMATDLIP